jgi:hypothetical protein
LALSKEIKVRNIAVEILQNKKSIAKTEINGEKITIIAANIPELNWHLLEILK